VRVIAFLGSDKTSLVYHLAWMYAELGLSVIAADFDPRANLTGMFLEDDRLETLWLGGNHPGTLFGAIQPLLDGTGDVDSLHVEPVEPKLGLLAGDLRLVSCEDEFSRQWVEVLNSRSRSFTVLSAFWRVLERAARVRAAELMLIDVGPLLGALDRVVLLAADQVIVAASPDLYSLQGMRNLGPTLRRWRHEWAERLPLNPTNLEMPRGSMRPAGYVFASQAVRLDRPTKAYEKWISRIPSVYREAMLGTPAPAMVAVKDDPFCLAALKPYYSLAPLAQEARKPMFFLKPADGAIGGHAAAVRECYRDFRTLARRIIDSAGTATS
jgi:cellulose biosynthesis protein BcsQ